jgi:DNA polymerase-4
VAPNKLLAKVGTRLVKPLGEYIVGTGEEAAFLAPLPLWLIPGVEAADVIRFRSLNLTRVDQAAALDLDQLAIPFGKRAPFLHDTLRGMDPSPVRSADAAPPTVMAEQVFDSDTNRAPVLEGALYRLVEQAGRALREQRLAARRVGVFLDYADGVRRVRSAAIRPASANDITLFEKARAVFYSAWSRRIRVRHLRLVCDRLTFPPAQQPLFAHERAADAKRTALVTALDRVRDRFGREAVQVGRTLAA